MSERSRGSDGWWRHHRVWTHRVRCYYAEGVTKKTRYGARNVGGELAIETIHVGESSASMEADAARRRPEIGRVEIVDLRSDPVDVPWGRIAQEGDG